MGHAVSLDPDWTPSCGSGSDGGACGSKKLLGDQLELSMECCDKRLFSFHDDELVDATTGQRFRTDLCTIAGLYTDQAGVNCPQVCKAVCVTLPELREGAGYLNMDPGLLEGEVVPELLQQRQQQQQSQQQPQRQLSVPPDFQGLAYDWTAPSHCQAALSEKQQAKIQRCLKQFLREMLAGVDLQLDAQDYPVDATSAAPKCIHAVLSLSPDALELWLSAEGTSRSVPLRAIRSVRPPPDEEGVVVVRLAGGRFMRLVLDCKEQAAYLGTCLRLLAKSARPVSSEKGV